MKKLLFSMIFMFIGSFAFALNSEAKDIEGKKNVAYEQEYDCIAVVNKCGMVVGDCWPKGTTRDASEVIKDADSYCD